MPLQVKKDQLWELAKYGLAAAGGVHKNCAVDTRSPLTKPSQWVDKRSRDVRRESDQIMDAFMQGRRLDSLAGTGYRDVLNTVLDVVGPLALILSPKIRPVGTALPSHSLPCAVVSYRCSTAPFLISDTCIRHSPVPPAVDRSIGRSLESCVLRLTS